VGGRRATGDAASGGEEEVVYQRRDQILKLVTRAFFTELTKYGIKQDEVLRVASHLLDNVLTQARAPGGAGPAGDVPFTADAVVDEWEGQRRLTLDAVTLRPLDAALVPRVAEWLRAPAVRDSFVPAFPDGEEALRAHFAWGAGHQYFAIHHDGAAVGIIGGENIDPASGKVEMKKLIGDADLRGKGIGKRATFLFLYYAFTILGAHKVYVHSRDINVRNINLNSGFGFELEGMFLEDAQVAGRRVDLVRMALLAPIWRALFSGPLSPLAARGAGESG
jgi:RimJ/RimL family protein N-acetyltransferase